MQSFTPTQVVGLFALSPELTVDSPQSQEYGSQLSESLGGALVADPPHLVTSDAVAATVAHLIAMVHREVRGMGQ